MTIPIVPLVVATALFMENLDSTILATALPVMARDLGTDPVHMKLALTSYLLAIAIFVPISGWVADRFGARRVFVAALLVFTVASALCGTAKGLGDLVLWRVLQGVGGAMMTPVGRLVVLRSVPKAGLVSALAWFTIPALLGPLLGPPVGGFVVTITTWQWVFWINVPIGILGAILAWRLVPDIREETRVPFDVPGFVLLGLGLVLMVSATTFLGVGQLSLPANLAMAACGLAFLGAYIRHASRTAHPVLDLGLLRFPTFRASILGGMPFRIGVGATPFLLPLMLQVGFGLDALQSGLITFTTGVGALAMKFSARPILAFFGFRRTLIWNGVLVAVLAGIPALFTAQTPTLLISVVLLAAGFLRSLQFTAVNAIAYAEVSSERMGNATAFSAVAQQIGISLGVSTAALWLDGARAFHGHESLQATDFTWAFAGVAVIAASSTLLFRALPADAARDLAAAPTRDATPPRPAEA